MPRANRHFLPGQVWHITHRCHQQAFLLTFARDRQHYLRCLLGDGIDALRDPAVSYAQQFEGEPHVPVLVFFALFASFAPLR